MVRAQICQSTEMNSPSIYPATLFTCTPCICFKWRTHGRPLSSLYSLTENQIKEVFIFGGTDDIQVLLDDSIVTVVKIGREGGRKEGKEGGKEDGR